jgi:hypothetical protein
MWLLSNWAVMVVVVVDDDEKGRNEGTVCSPERPTLLLNGLQLPSLLPLLRTWPWP